MNQNWILAANSVYVPIWVALIFLVGTLGTPVLLRIIDWKRQDAVANKVSEAAGLLAKSNDAVAASNRDTHEQLRTIHTLVNSTLTAALTAELGATIRELASLNELIDLKIASGREPSKDTLVAQEACKIRIDELKDNLADRSRQQAIVEASKGTK